MRHGLLLTPEGKPAGKVYLVKEGKPQGSIQIPEHPTPQETNAAAQLQLWMKEMTGATLPINSGGASRGRIFIGTDGSLGDEGYRITVSGGQLVLSGGKTRGVMNAEYAKELASPPFLRPVLRKLGALAARHAFFSAPRCGMSQDPAARCTTLFHKPLDGF